MNTDGYAAMPRSILANRDITANEKLTYLALTCFVGADGTCWPSLATLCRVTSLSQSTVQRCLRSLRDEHRLIKFEQPRVEKGRFTVTTYQLQQPVVRVTSGDGRVKVTTSLT